MKITMLPLYNRLKASSKSRFDQNLAGSLDNYFEMLFWSDIYFQFSGHRHTTQIVKFEEAETLRLMSQDVPTHIIYLLIYWFI